MRITLGTVTVLVLTIGIAHAQRAPDMATFDRGDGISKIGIDTGLTFLEDPTDTSYDLALRAEVYGQYVMFSGLGFYGALPLAASFGAPGDDEDPDPPDLLANDAVALGDLDLGLLYTITQSPTFSLVFRGGVGFPTATSSRDGIATLLAATAPRLTDLALATDAWYGRLSVSPLIYANRFFLQADAGVDVGLEDGADSLLRLNAGAGYDFGVIAFSLELVNIVGLTDGDDDFSHTLTGTVRFMGDEHRLFLAVGAPLDDSAADLYLAVGFHFLP
jgi:hypothetical protein